MSEEDFPIRAEPKIAGQSSADSAAEAEQLLRRLVAATPDSEASLKRVLETLQSQTHSLVVERNQIRAERDALESRVSQGRIRRFLLISVLLIALGISASGLVYVVSYLGDTDGVIAQLQSDVARLTGDSEPVTTGRLSSESGAGLLLPPIEPLASEPADPARLGDSPVGLSPSELERAVRQSSTIRALAGHIETLREALAQSTASVGEANDQLHRLTGEFAGWRTAQEKAAGQLDENAGALEAANNRLDAIVRDSSEFASTLSSVTDEIGARLDELERKDSVRRAKTPSTPKPVSPVAAKPAKPKIREIYTTGPDDTLLSISRKFGVSVNRLLEVNGGTLDDASRLLAAKQQVIIPE